MNNRKEYIDIYKGMLMILVIIGHLHYFDYDGRTLTLIYSFHMPAFLIIAGYLSNITDSSTYISIFSKRFKNTIIPYFLFNFISLIIIPKGTLNEQILAFYAIFRGLGDPIHSINLPLWFLTYFFVAMTAFEVLNLLSIKISNSIKNNKTNLINIILLFFVSIFMYVSYKYARVYRMDRLPFNIEVALFSLLFVYVGKVFKDYKDILLNLFKKIYNKTIFKTICIFIYILIVIFWYKLSLKNGRIDLNARDYKNAMLMYINAFLGFIMFSLPVYIASKIKYLNTLLSFLGRISLYILAYHIPAKSFTYLYVNIFMPSFILLKLNEKNLFSISYFVFMSILFSIGMYFLHKFIRFLIKSKII